MPLLSLHSPFGELTVTEEDGHIVSLDWGRAPEAFQEETPLLLRARDQLDRYFDGAAAAFDLALAPAGTPLQQQVWRAMCAIPRGATRTYGALAREFGAPARAIGSACGSNPIPIIIPCHRIVAANGDLGGYSGDGGADTKLALLRLEGALLL